MFWCTTIICVWFSAPSETSPKHGLWTLQQHLLVTKIVDQAIRRSQWVPTQGCTADEPSLRSFGRSKRRCFEPRCESAHCPVRFSNFSEDFRQTNCGVPLKIDRPTLPKWNSRHMTSFAAEIGDYLIRSAFYNFRCIWLVFEDLEICEDCLWVAHQKFC